VRLLLGLVVPMASACALIVITGCEEVTRNKTINITPASPEIRRTEAIVLTASLAVSTSTNGLYLPLEWSMSDPTLGNFAGAAGNSVVYQAGGRGGNNTIRVRDQADNEGVTNIRQI